MFRAGMSRNRARVLVLAAAGLPVFALIHCLAYWLRFDSGLVAREIQNAAITLAIVVTTKTIAFLAFRIYQSWNRYVSLHDLVELVKATTASSLLLAAVDYLFLTSFNVPRSIFLMDWGITILVVGCLRCAFRFFPSDALEDRERPEPHQKWSVHQKKSLPHL